MLTNRDESSGKVIRVNESKVQILYEDGSDQGPHIHYWLARDEDPPLVWKPAPPSDPLDVHDFDDWNAHIRPDLWNQRPLSRKSERPRTSYPIENDVRIEQFMSMSAVELFFQFLPQSFWKKVVTASNKYAVQVLSHPSLDVSFTLLNHSVECLWSCTILK